ncbi:DUF6461 domain-containing protein [Streptomyces sp. JV176]|uniref:DUF6461 domain-containing protein n=1 Tax=Streptomyces sp. JV176 TaxID=858630 RepID=UPI002E759A1C|nr:DUF6461 domain-containing protein [Streptomyces sp. JV176]MEE1800885.1 DUF6461 domain-containing protein [Streptomyces sp. JV176]
MVEPVIEDGIGWLLEPYLVDCVTFARGIGPGELVARLGARPAGPVGPASVAEALDALAAPGVDGVARVGRAAGWSFAVEYGDAVGPTPAGLAAVSRGGVEAVSFLLTPSHPPSVFRHYEDGRHICSFGIGAETHRVGSDPDLLVPALTELAVLPVVRGLDGARRERSHRRTMRAVQDHFGLRLPRHDVVEGRLPLHVVRER